MNDLVEALQQAKAAYRQARRELAAYARQHWIGKRATVVKTSYAFTSNIVSITPAGRVRLDGLSGSVSFDIEEIELVERREKP